MDKTKQLPNFELTANATLSSIARQLGLNNFEEAAKYIQQLSYRRTSRKSDLSLVFKEECGTCSTKHATLAQLALENNISSIELTLGIYQMMEQNTPGVGKVLEATRLTYVPEAHMYLRHQGQRFDLTFNGMEAALSPFDSLMDEISIEPQQIGDFKVHYHKQFLKQWLVKQSFSYSLDEVWKIREACIAALST